MNAIYTGIAKAILAVAHVAIMAIDMATDTVVGLLARRSKTDVWATK